VKAWLIAVGLCFCACGGEAGDETESGSTESAATWCCETQSSDGTARFSRFCGITEAEALDWMRNPDEVCWDDAS
jgi:hypothetical protein